MGTRFRDDVMYGADIGMFCAMVGLLCKTPIRVNVVDGISIGIGVEVEAEGVSYGVRAKEPAPFGVVISGAHPDEAGGVLGLAVPG